MISVILSYETLDRIADAVIPALLIIFLLTAAVTFFRAPDSRKALGKTCLYFLLLVVIAYGLMFLDRRFHLWQAAGLDYSTHTAVSLALGLPLCLLLNRFKGVVIAVLVAYTALMLYQGYHSIQDILTTAVVILAGAFLIYRWLFRRQAV